MLIRIIAITSIVFSVIFAQQTDTFNARPYISVYTIQLDTLKDTAIAYSYWRPVFFNEPCTLKRIVADGVDIFHYKIRHAKSIEEKNAYIDTLLMIIDYWNKCFPDEPFGHPGFVAGMKAYELSRFAPERYADIYKFGLQSLNSLGNNTPYFVLSPLMWSAIRLYADKVLPADSVLKVYSTTKKVIEANKNSQDSQYYRSVSAQIDNMLVRSGIFKDCNQAEQYLADILETTTDSSTWMLAYSVLLSKKCYSSGLFVKVARYMLDSLHDKGAIIPLAVALKEQDKCRQAISVLEENASKLGSSEAISKAYLQAAQWTYSCLKDYPYAYKLAKKAVDANPRFGKAWIFIGDLYAASSSICKEKLDAKAVYWLAIDMYNKAMQVDPSVKQLAQKKIARAKQHTPTREEAFFYLLKEGDTYTVGCWINKSTTVRFYH